MGYTFKRGVDYYFRDDTGGIKGVGALRWKVKTGFIDWNRGEWVCMQLLVDG